jgi:trk system potassium uptake protein TrkA
MKFVIVGCGRVGSVLAEKLDTEGHTVIIVDLRTEAFDRLPASFKGNAVRGDGTDEDILRRAGAEGADVFLSLTEGDNRNIMSAQLAAEALGIGKVVAKINDPLRALAYSDMGLATLCRTNLMVDSVAEYLGLPIQAGPGIVPPSHRAHGPHDAEGRPLPAPALPVAQLGARPATDRSSQET